MAYYHDLITQKSWEELKKLKKKFNFVLIGGWAVYLYSKTLKSKDIDILIEYEELIKLRKVYEISKNERLKKYEARKEEIQIDIYLPHYSSLGIPVEDLMKEMISFEGFRIVKKEWLITLKIFTLSQRGRTVKGQKDFLDLLSLMSSDFQPEIISNLVGRYRLQNELIFFKMMLNERVEVKELDFNRHFYKKLKEKIAII